METEAKTPPKEHSHVSRSSSSSSDLQTHLDSPHSPQRFHSPLRSHPPETPPYASPADSPQKLSPMGSLEKQSPLRSPEKPSPLRSPEKLSPEKQPPIFNSKAIVSVDKSIQFSASPSPSPPHSLDDLEESKFQPKNTPAEKEPKSPPKYTVEEPDESKSPPDNKMAADEEKSPSPMVLFNRSVKENVPPVTTRKMQASSGGRDSGRSGAVAAILRRTRREELTKFAALGFRLSGVVLSLISFSVMAADKTQGWSGDSFDRYKEYRYCLSVNVIAFVYSMFQAFDLGYYLVKEKHLIRHHLRPLFDFLMDQILAYLLISASSAAATRVDDWVSNWGKDEFTIMASASVAMSFSAFLAFAFSSLISGYILYTQQSI